jgi:predicted phosphoribosyltransferase
MMIKQFDDRREGGRALTAKLSPLKTRKDVVVLALQIFSGLTIRFIIFKTARIMPDEN